MGHLLAASMLDCLQPVMPWSLCQLPPPHHHHWEVTSGEGLRAGPRGSRDRCCRHSPLRSGGEAVWQLPGLALSRKGASGYTWGQQGGQTSQTWPLATSMVMLLSIF